MASTNHLLFIVALLLPFVENAPSNIVNQNSKDDELRLRLVFIDREANNVINNNFKMTDDTSSRLPVSQPQSRVSTRSKHFAKSTWMDNNPHLEAKSSTTSKMEDERQIWGIVDDNKDLVEDESYYIRPLALPKTVVKTISENTNRDVTTTETSKVLKINNNVPKPSACDVSIVICCVMPSTIKECFRSQGCSNATDDMFPHLCSPDSINRTVALLGSYYNGGPKK